MDKKIFLIILVLVVVGFVVYYFGFSNRKIETANQNTEQTENKSEEQPAEINTGDKETNNSNGTIIGLEKKILKEGKGVSTKVGNKITVNYTGWLEDGTKFDSSLDRNQPFSFTLGSGQVIEGWDIGLIDSKVGEKLKLTIPSRLAYGESGAGNGLIPPGANLIFEIEVLKIE